MIRINNSNQTKFNPSECATIVKSYIINKFGNYKIIKNVHHHYDNLVNCCLDKKNNKGAPLQVTGWIE